MKDPKEYLMQTFYNGIFIELHSGDIDDVVDIMKQVQVDAYNEALEDAAKKATTCEDPNSYCGNTGSEYPPDLIVNKQSILRLKK